MRQIANYETFHPGIGPLAEANALHVEQQRICERASAHYLSQCAEQRAAQDAGPTPFIIWDVGLGAAANALAAITALNSVQVQQSGQKTQVEIHSFDQTTEPLEFALGNAEALQYLLPYRNSISQLLQEGQVALSPSLNWVLHLGDFRKTMSTPQIPAPHSVFYDPYSPKSNAEMWSLEHFTHLRQRIGNSTQCLLTNYTRSTQVRATWLLAGFYVGVGSSIGEKAETSVASNSLEALKAPLGERWIQRLKASRMSAPLTEEQSKIITAEQLNAIESHPQFSKTTQPR